MTKVLEPPDGGYGWVIVFASILNNFFMVPLIQNVVLIFKDKMLEIDMTITQMWFTLNVHTCFGQITGLINSSLLKWFGYRKVTLAGVSFVFFGLSMSSWIHNYLGFMLTFGLVTALGVGLNTSSYTMAMKSYFVRNQNKAIGLSMTLTALGPILMPQIVNLLVHIYHPDGVILILAGIMAHCYIGAFLLQPVKKHMVRVKKDEEQQDEEMHQESSEEENLRREALDELMPQIGPPRQYQLFPPREFISNRRFPGFRRKDSIISISYEQEQAAIMGLDSTLGGSLYSLESADRRRSSAFGPTRYITKTTWWKSEESINLASCYDIFEEQPVPDEEASTKEEKGKKEKKGKKKKTVHLDDTFHYEERMFYKELNFNINNLPWFKRWFYRTVELFGLDIFLDLRYVNIMIGFSLAIIAEMNFTVLLPFLLFEYSLTISQVAAFLSVLGAADILFRFLAPLIGDCLKQSARIMIVLVLSVLIFVRCALIFVSDYPTVLIIAFVLGCVKGLRVVYMSLIIPNYVPPERLASASAIQIISNSVMSLLGGHVIGVTRTKTGSYIYCVILLNCLTAVTIVMWTVDLIYKRFHRRKVEESNTINIAQPSEVY